MWLEANKVDKIRAKTGTAIIWGVQYCVGHSMWLLNHFAGYRINGHKCSFSRNQVVFLKYKVCLSIMTITTVRGENGNAGSLKTPSKPWNESVEDWFYGRILLPKGLVNSQSGWGKILCGSIKVTSNVISHEVKAMAQMGFPNGPKP